MIFFSLLALGAPAAGAPAVLLNEVLYDPPGADAGYEFVELISTQDEPLALAGLRLEFCNGSSPGDWRLLWEGGAQDSLAAGALFLIAESEVPGAQCQVSLAMQNGPEALRLVAEGATLDLLGYGEDLAAELCEAWPAQDPSGKSLARRPDGIDTDQNALDWFPAEPSPGALNLPDFRVRLRSAQAPFPPVGPGDPLTLRVRAANEGALAWPAPLPLQLVDKESLGLLAASGELPAALPGHESEAELLLPAPPPGERSYWLYAGLPGQAAAESLQVPVRVGVGPLLLSEVLFAPRSGEPEWVECLALEAQDGLAAFVLADLSGTEAGFVAPALAAGERFLLCADRELLLAGHPELPAGKVLAASPWPSLANSGASEEAPGWTDGLRLDDALGRRSDGLLYRGDWIGDRGASLERLSLYPPPGLSPWSPCPTGTTPLAGPDMLAGEAPAEELRLEPNPFDPERERLCLTLCARGATLSLRLFDAAGRPVQDMEERLGAGQARLFWDGKDRFGSPLPDGAYPFVLQWEGEDGALRFREGVCAVRRRRS